MRRGRRVAGGEEVGNALLAAEVSDQKAARLSGRPARQWAIISHGSMASGSGRDHRIAHQGTHGSFPHGQGEEQIAKRRRGRSRALSDPQ